MMKTSYLTRWDENTFQISAIIKKLIDKIGDRGL